MTEQLSLIPRARKTDDRTSHAAAARMAEASPALEAQILDLLNRYSSLTKNEVAFMLGVDQMRYPSVASALSRLKNAGKLRWRGDSRDGMNLWCLNVDAVVETNGRL